jgi:hypothetical protein
MTSIRAGPGLPPVTGMSRVGLHPLRMRRDGEAWVIGRVETGEFISAPPVAQRAISLLSRDQTVTEVRAALQAEGTDVNVVGFVTTLAGLGFLSHIDGHRLEGPEPPRPTFPWLRPAHVRWVLHPATAAVAAVLILAGAGPVLIGRAPVPGYHDLIWSTSGGLVLLGNAAIAWTIIFVHEMAHLAAARAAGVPGRMSLSTRLQFLAAQTDVSGIWAAPRQVRLTVYLAGMTVNLLIFALCVPAAAIAVPAGLAHRLLVATGLISVLFVPPQFLVFMRSDVYFVLQDITGCANLYADGSAYFRYLAGRLWSAVSRRGRPSADPSRNLPARQRRAVRAYTVILAGGTAACLAVAATTTLPTAITLLARAVAAITGGSSVAGRFDALAVITVIGGFQLLWSRAWWRRHGHRVRRLRGHLYPNRRKEVR